MFKKLGTIALGSALAFSLAACDDSSSKTSTDTKDKPKQEAKQEAKKENKKKITAAEVEAIKTGDSMSGEGGDKYEDIVAKFGEPDSKSESSAGDMKMLMAS